MIRQGNYTSRKAAWESIPKAITRSMIREEVLRALLREADEPYFNEFIETMGNDENYETLLHPQNIGADNVYRPSFEARLETDKDGKYKGNQTLFVNFFIPSELTQAVKANRNTRPILQSFRRNKMADENGEGMHVGIRFATLAGKLLKTGDVKQNARAFRAANTQECKTLYNQFAKFYKGLGECVKKVYGQNVTIQPLTEFMAQVYNQIGTQESEGFLEDINNEVVAMWQELVNDVGREGALDALSDFQMAIVSEPPVVDHLLSFKNRLSAVAQAKRLGMKDLTYVASAGTWKTFNRQPKPGARVLRLQTPRVEGNGMGYGKEPNNPNYMNGARILNHDPIRGSMKYGPFYDIQDTEVIFKRKDKFGKYPGYANNLTGELNKMAKEKIGAMKSGVMDREVITKAGDMKGKDLLLWAMITDNAAKRLGARPTDAKNAAVSPKGKNDPSVLIQIIESNIREIISRIVDGLDGGRQANDKRASDKAAFKQAMFIAIMNAYKFAVTDKATATKAKRILQQSNMLNLFSQVVHLLNQEKMRIAADEERVANGETNVDGADYSDEEMA